MHGAPEAAAVWRKDFVARRNQNQQIGVVAFNGSIDVLARPSANGAAVNAALARAPALSYGTRIYDALTRSLVLLEHAHVSSGSIVLLSDGADLGSRSSLQSVPHVRRATTFSVHRRSSLGKRLPRTAADRGRHRGSFWPADSPRSWRRLHRARAGSSAGLLPTAPRRGPGTHVSVAAFRRRRRQRNHGLRRADAVKPGAIPPVAALTLPALGRIARAARALGCGADRLGGRARAALYTSGRSRPSACVFHIR